MNTQASEPQDKPHRLSLKQKLPVIFLLLSILLLLQPARYPRLVSPSPITFPKKLLHIFAFIISCTREESLYKHLKTPCFLFQRLCQFSSLLLVLQNSKQYPGGTDLHVVAYLEVVTFSFLTLPPPCPDPGTMVYIPLSSLG